MARSGMLSVIFLFGATTYAAYDEFFFASEKTQWQCPDLGFDCVAPQICAHEGLLDKYYCCGTGSTDAVCWNGATDCGNSNNEPSTNQIGCSSGDSAFCCLSDREECTQRFNQINICWATSANPVANVSSDKVNATFSSLSSARPQATSWTLDIAALTATSTPSSASASSTPASSASTSASPSTSNTGSPSPSSDSDSSGVSGGTIAGAVVGAIGGIALLAGGAFFLFRRNRNKKASKAEMDGSDNPYLHNGYGAVPQQAPPPPQEKYAHEAGVQMPGSDTEGVGRPPVEMPVETGPMEMEGSKPQGRV